MLTRNILTHRNVYFLMGILTHIELCFLMGILILEKSNITIVHPGVSLLLFLTKVMYEVSYLYA